MTNVVGIGSLGSIKDRAEAAIRAASAGPVYKHQTSGTHTTHFFDTKNPIEHASEVAKGIAAAIGGYYKGHAQNGKHIIAKVVPGVGEDNDHVFVVTPELNPGGVEVVHKRGSTPNAEKSSYKVTPFLVKK